MNQTLWDTDSSLFFFSIAFNIISADMFWEVQQTSTEQPLLALNLRNGMAGSATNSSDKIVVVIAGSYDDIIANQGYRAEIDSFRSQGAYILHFPGEDVNASIFQGLQEVKNIITPKHLRFVVSDSQQSVMVVVYPK